MEPKYGKVYITEREIFDGREIVVPTLLEAVRFSNTDHKWYNSDGNDSPLYETFNGRPKTVQFKLNLEDKHGKEVEFEAKILLPFKHGELPPQDFENWSKATHNNMEHWKRLGMFPDDFQDNHGSKYLRDISCASFVASLSPGCKIADMNSLRTSIDPWFMLDEWIDKPGSQNDTPFKQMELYISTLTDIMEGKNFADVDRKLRSELEEIPEQYSRILIGMQAFRKVLTEKELDTEPLIQGFNDYHNALILENCSEWNEKRGNSTSVMFKALHKELRMEGSAAKATVEMILFDKNIQLPKKIRESFVFKSLIRTYNQHCIFVNDLMSLKKEMANGETSNTIFFLHDSKNMSLQDALQNIIEEISLATNVVIETGEVLLNLYGEYPEAAKLMETIKGIMYGNIMWCGMCERYIPDVTLDYVVELA